MEENHRHKNSKKRLSWNLLSKLPEFWQSWFFIFIKGLDLSVSTFSILLSGSSLTWTQEQLCSLSLPEAHTVVRAAQQQAEPTGKVYGENLIFFPLTSLPYKFQFTLKVITHRKLLILKLIIYMSVVYHLWFDYPKRKAEFFQLGGFSTMWASKRGWILGKKSCAPKY